MKKFLIATVIFGAFIGTVGCVAEPAKKMASAVEIKPADWVFIDNGIIRLGVKKTAGAGIGWLSRSGSQENLLDNYDSGRFIQQSYYGKEDGSMWGKNPWRWNPVQGGDYKGNPSEVLELTTTQTSLYARIRPRNWAGGELLNDCVMEQTIVLEGAEVLVKFGFRYSGTVIHPVHDQEVPATFVNPAYGTMIIYEGNQPWNGGPLTSSQPGWPNEYRKIPEGWAAWVNEKNTGIGVYSSIANNLTCYRFGSSPQALSACSYVAPLAQFAITPGMHFEYKMAIALGTPEEMRVVFAKLKDSLCSESSPSSSKK